MDRTIRIGTRESQLAVWQATQVQQLLTSSGYSSELVFIKSEGDIFKPVIGKGINLEKVVKELSKDAQ